MANDAELAQATPPEELIHLYDPEFASLAYGPNNDIVFGPRGGFDAHHWYGPRNHPLLPALLRDHPTIREWDAPKTVVFACDECGAEFGTKAGLRSHRRSQHPTK